MPLKPRDVLHGQYRILDQIGEGGFGFVYRARDELLHKEVAVKELIPGLVGNPAILKRFVAEARATMELTHERIVRTHTIFPEGGNYYIVMEYMPGGSLEGRLRQGGPLPVDQAVGITAQVCEGLAYAHQRGVVHCDLKPANILFAAEGSAKVADFGIAHVSDQTLTRSWHTSGGFVAGTLPYMSPEQAEGVRDDPRLDIYALGAVLYRMLTGRTYLDFDPSDTPRAQSRNVERICTEQPLPPIAHNPRIQPWLDAVILRALSKRPEDRFPTAEAFAAALVQRAKTASSPPPRVPEPAPTPAPRQRPWQRNPVAWLTAGTALVLLAVLGLSLALLGGPGGRRLTSTLTPQSAALVSKTATVWPTYRPSPAATSTLIPRGTASHTPRPTSTTAPTRAFTAQGPLIPSATPADARRRIAFNSDRDGNREVYVMNADGSDQTRLMSSPADDLSPVWSPDGKRIAFSTDRDGNYEIYVMNPDGSGLTRLTNNPANDTVDAWSLDGTRIAFTTDRDGNFEIYIMNPDGSGQTNLTKEPANDYLSAWSPDGTSVAFTTDRDGNDEIYVMNADGSGLTRLTNSPADDWDPAWSPDGNRVAFASDRDGNFEIYIMNADGSEQTNLTKNPADDLHPAPSPDGQGIAFVSNRDGNDEIYVMNADGSGQVNLTNNPANDARPAWSPL